MKYIHVARTKLEKHIEDYWKDGDRELSDAWTGFTRFILLRKEWPSEGNTWCGWRLTSKQSTSRPDDIWPDMWKHMSDAAKKNAKPRWAMS